MTPSSWRRYADRDELVERVRSFDEAVDKALEKHRTATADRFFYPLSSAADHSVIWVLIAAARRASANGHAHGFRRSVAVLGAESFLTNVLVKSYFKRRRPIDFSTSGEPLPYGLRRPVTSSFPSGHATSAFTAAAFLSKGDPLAPAYYGLATMVAASRVYVRLHHASDVVAGAAFGFALGRIARRLVGK